MKNPKPLRTGAWYCAGFRVSDPISTPAALMHARPPHQAAKIAPTLLAPVPAAPPAREFASFAEYLRAVVKAAAGERCRPAPAARADRFVGSRPGWRWLSGA